MTTARPGIGGASANSRAQSTLGCHWGTAARDWQSQWEATKFFNRQCVLLFLFVFSCFELTLVYFLVTS